VPGALGSLLPVGLAHKVPAPKGSL
jgi:anti-sigma factor RsiW